MVKTVDEYIAVLKSPQKDILKILRELIKKTYPKIEEHMKYGVPYYGDNYYIVALKDHVNLGFTIKGLSKEDLAQFEGNGKLTRHFEIAEVNEIDEKRIVRLLNLVMKHE